MQAVIRHKSIESIHPKQQKQIDLVIEGMTFTKNFRSATAEEWYIFLPGFKDPQSGGAAAKAIIHYNLYGNKNTFISG